MLSPKQNVKSGHADKWRPSKLRSAWGPYVNKHSPAFPCRAPLFRLCRPSDTQEENRGASRIIVKKRGGAEDVAQDYQTLQISRRVPTGSSKSCRAELLKDVCRNNSAHDGSREPDSAATISTLVSRLRATVIGRSPSNCGKCWEHHFQCHRTPAPTLQTQDDLTGTHSCHLLSRHWYRNASRRQVALVRIPSCQRIERRPTKPRRQLFASSECTKGSIEVEKRMGRELHFRTRCPWPASDSSPLIRFDSSYFLIVARPAKSGVLWLMMSGRAWSLPTDSLSG